MYSTLALSVMCTCNCSFRSQWSGADIAFFENKKTAAHARRLCFTASSYEYSTVISFSKDKIVRRDACCDRASHLIVPTSMLVGKSTTSLCRWDKYPPYQLYLALASAPDLTVRR